MSLSRPKLQYFPFVIIYLRQARLLDSIAAQKSHLTLRFLYLALKTWNFYLFCGEIHHDSGVEDNLLASTSPIFLISPSFDSFSERPALWNAFQASQSIIIQPHLTQD
jgi:hypothetical protein